MADQPSPPPTRAGVLLGRLPFAERQFILDTVRAETVGGALLLIAAIAGLLFANTGLSDVYEDLQDYVIGPKALHLNLTLQTWAADGLLAIFFFIAGLELKRELVVGTLRSPSAAALPIVAAVCGMVVPALVFFAVTWDDAEARDGWAIPTATDIAFALAVLAVVSTHLPPALRAFLLTLAIVDDMGAITVIAVFFTDDLSFLYLGLALLGAAAYAWLQRRRVRSTWIYVPLVFAVWTLVHESGVHATIAGVLLGLLTRVRPDPGEHHSPAERLEHRLRPLSAAFAVPAFAFLSAGVALDGNPLALLDEPVPLGIVLGLVVGKFVGVLGGSYAVARWTHAELDPELSWKDMAGLALLSGVGFTVSLLIAELAFEGQPVLDDAKVAVLMGSVLAAVLAAILLRLRNRVYRLLEEEDTRDSDGDGIPDVYQQQPTTT
ncbi:MAG: Na+/H+ antiporter NhaA [Candidatus Nanopelagicales bacterium]